ncbi:UDP-N-acetylglucosamine 2-epimerase [Hydrogenovibrio thermophilus]|nr:UDP-N-acetylglucosamine 2-epimerase [Hydrogenovibrio thermophilus]
MSDINRIALVTSGRADYGLLKPLWQKLQADALFAPTMIATGSHLVAEQGETISVLKADGIEPLLEVDMALQGDQPSQLAEASGQALARFGRLFEQHDFDLVVILGDRFEMLAVAMAAMLNRLPIAHLHGGEATFGLIDDAVRHSLTKMSALHFVSHDDYARRVIQMGEQPSRVFNVGAIGLDNIVELPLLSSTALQDETGVDWTISTVLMTYHPVTLNDASAAAQEMEVVLDAVIASGLQTVITMPNIDAGGEAMYQVIVAAQQAHPEQLHLVKSLGQLRYLSAMQHCAMVLGNSSSGIIEAASFQKPVVNIGERQLGRVTGANVLHVDCQTEAILQAIETALSDAFVCLLAGVKNPYGNGHTAEKIVGHLKTLSLQDRSALLKKGFHDCAEACS